MRQRLAEVEQQWQKYTQARQAPPPLPQSQSLSSIPSTSLPSPNPPSDSSECCENGNAETASKEEGSPQNGNQQQPSPSFSPMNGNGSANFQTAPSAAAAARGRIAKFTASLIGAASGTIGYNNQNSVDENGEGSLTLREIEDQFMGLKIREADTLAELKEMRQKVMELETQNHVCTNQLKRQDDELKRVREEKEAMAKAEREVSNLLRDEQRKLLEAQSEMKEKNVMQRLKYTEALQTIADLKQQILSSQSKVQS